MLALIAGLLVLLGTHSASIVAPRWVDRTKARIGANAWRILYSLLSLAGLILTIIGYARARAELVIFYVPPLWLQYVAVVLMVFTFPILASTYLPGRIKATLKHPTLVATKLWATAHLLANGSRGDVILFGAILLWAGADRISLRYRSAPLPASTSSSARNDVIAIVVGLIVYAVFILGLHARLFGVPIPGPWS